MKVFIYSLTDPNTNIIRYVGKTTNLKRRLTQHLYDAKSKHFKVHVYNWINTLIQNSQKPIMNVIEECTEVDWQEREIYWINYYRQSSNLCNHHDGGLGCLGRSGRIISQEERLRLKKLGHAQSYFSEEEKVLIWKLIQENYSFEEIKIKYPKLPKVSYNAVKTGRLWKHITNLTPPPKQKAIRVGKDCKKSKPVICTKTNIIYESARQAWLLLYADKYKYNYIICMLRGHNKNVTSLVYLT